MHPFFEYLLLCDIDNTLTGDDAALRTLMTLLEEKRGHIGFGVATGRSIESTAQILGTLGIDRVDVSITAVGSEIYYDDGSLLDEEWRAHIDHAWRRETVIESLSSIEGVYLQAHPLAQRAHKASFVLDDARRMGAVERALDGTTVRYRAILSHGNYLDILPHRASKGLAIAHVAKRIGIADKKIIVAGDSENDRSMLEGPYLGILVANHEESLGDLKECYRAKTPFAGGVAEGLQWWGVL